MFAAKLAVLLQIKRLFTTFQRDFVYWSVQTLIVTNFVVYLATFLGTVFACWPREKIWNPNVPGKCLSPDGCIIATGVLNLASDITILLLPAYVILRLNLRLRKKLGVMAIFATGAL